jgi:hypothetical protein
MLVRIVYAALLVTALGAFPRTTVHRTARRAQAQTGAGAEAPTWAPRSAPERYCAAGDEPDVDRGPDFAIPRIDR